MVWNFKLVCSVRNIFAANKPETVYSHIIRVGTLNNLHVAAILSISTAESAAILVSVTIKINRWHFHGMERRLFVTIALKHPVDNYKQRMNLYSP